MLSSARFGTAARLTAALGAVALATVGLAGCASNAAAPSADDVRTYTVVTSGGPKPYTFIGDDGQPTGFDIEVLKAVDERLPDVEFRYEVTDFPAMFAGLDAGRYDIAANNLATTAERAGKYDFTTPHFQMQYGIIVPADSPLERITSFEDLAGKRVYGTPGLNFTKILEKYNETHPDAQVIIEYTDLDYQTQHQNLVAGLVDFAFAERVMFDNYDVKAGLPVKFLDVDPTYLTQNFGTAVTTAFALSRNAEDEPQLKDEIDGALVELSRDGTLARLSEQFLGGDFALKLG